MNEKHALSSPLPSHFISHPHDTTKTNFTVVIRIRPPLARELNGESGFVDILSVGPDHRTISVTESPDAPPHRFTFDHVYSHETSQEVIYRTTAREAVLSTLDGYNNTILAYGQTGTGKTYTTEGWCESVEFRGILPRMVEEVFSFVANAQKSGGFFTVRISYLQIYNEIVSDLLNPEQTHLMIREDKKRGVFCPGLSEWEVRSLQHVISLIRKGSANRARAATRLNDESSRSHALFTLIVEQEDKQQGQLKVGKLNLVDLAGSERLRVCGHNGATRIKETANINQSLSVLGNVISALTEHRHHVPYRDSKLTRLLADSLGGNCKTTLIAMVSPAQDAFVETFSTLKFALRAKSIQNSPRVNEFLDEHTLLRQYEAQLKALQKDLETRDTKEAGSKRVSDLEADKNSLQSTLEALRGELLRERQQKTELEAKAENIAKTGDRIREMYQARVRELEKERAAAVEAQSSYKGFLDKQRAILDQLTECLSERDHTISQLQGQLETSQSKRREVESALSQLRHAVRVQEETISGLQKKVAIQTKEKIAVRMIFEDKVKRLVDGVARVGLGERSALPHTTQLELQVLQRLVDASIAALAAT